MGQKCVQICGMIYRNPEDLVWFISNRGYSFFESQVINLIYLMLKAAEAKFREPRPHHRVEE